MSTGAHTDTRAHFGAAKNTEEIRKLRVETEMTHWQEDNNKQKNRPNNKKIRRLGGKRNWKDLASRMAVYRLLLTASLIISLASDATEKPPSSDMPVIQFFSSQSKVQVRKRNQSESADFNYWLITSAC